MINESLKFLAEEVNKYLSLKLGVNTDPRLILGNVSKAFDSEGGGTNSLTNKAILSLVNVEEDRLSKQQENYIKTDKGVNYKAPPVYLNLYILFAINRTEYLESLKWLGYILQYFQFQNVFTPLTHPALDGKVEKLVVDLYSLNFEQVNHLWSTLGGKYLPSALYKVRQVTIDEDLITGEGGFIKEIEINNQMLLPVS
jgi:hypothetical protein